jgi:hypothetical protein
VFRLKYASAKSLSEILQGLVSGQAVNSGQSNDSNNNSNLSSMKYFSFLASFGKLAYLDLSNKPL